VIRITPRHVVLDSLFKTGYTEVTPKKESGMTKYSIIIPERFYHVATFEAASLEEAQEMLDNGEIDTEMLPWSDTPKSVNLGALVEDDWNLREGDVWNDTWEVAE
jgi:hypothetical protein